MSDPGAFRLSRPDEETAHELPGGWTIHVRGDVEDDGGWSGGHFSGSRGMNSSHGTTVEEMIAAIDAQRAEDEREAVTPRRLVVRLGRDGVDVTVIDEARLPAEGPASLLWPPIVTPEGVVLRTLRMTTSFERIDGQPVGRAQAPQHHESTTQPGVLVTATGEVRELPFALGVSPLAVTPDGRLLLPNADPLWWDGGDEPMTLLALDGTAEPFLVDGAPVTPSRLLSAIGEPHSNATGDEADGPHWTIRQARLGEHELRLRLTNDEPTDRPTVEHALEWVAVTVSLAGRWAVRRLGTGTLLADEPLPPL